MVGGLSDHGPIQLSSIAIDSGPKPFSFENCWFMHKDFSPFARESWASFQVQGFAGFIVIKKMKMLKDIIKVRNRKVFGILVRTRISLTKDLEAWGMVEEMWLNLDEKKTKGDAYRKL